MTPVPAALAYDAALGAALDATGLAVNRLDAGRYLVALPGEHKLVTSAAVTLTDQALVVEAFVVRAPAENPAEVYRYLLSRNARAYGAYFALDRLGDVYLVGRLPHAAISPGEVDRLLGCVLAYADESFDVLLRLGFGSAIRREWAWRVSRGEPLDNLAAFADWAAGPDISPHSGPASGPATGPDASAALAPHAPGGAPAG